MREFSFADIPEQGGKTAIVTGANTGIGYEIARHLARKGARVILACRDGDKAAEAANEMKSGPERLEVDTLHLDLANIASVREAAETAAKEERIDILVNNAGIMRPPLDHATGGTESQFAVNHLGHFAFTALLFDKLKADGGARVVTQSSLAHRKGQIDLTNLDAAKGYDRWRFYQQSKLANLMFALELHHRCRAADVPVTSIACHPGIAASDLMRHMKGGALLQPVMGVVLNTSEQGALPALQAATDPEAEGGDYYGPYGLGEMRGKTSGRAVIAGRASEKPAASHLWERSELLTGIDFPI
ncbi:oxidoreductase [Aurantiacibacter gangjinensis]|uniref:Oxidoreductase n=1 Tax=Aurantiacibacter gangjinensis TaxID=502682 RepID=A0A0G9MRR4_9SPHN|nr:oxidoreductase [Aurantiacibacter gangjinensis]APE29173.1 putative oxidoreductase/Short-chain dehydrogenase [Aurantiacibacter gangjinensis]KLE33239.1 oxidoreductase [Aurantiacibacter gangjinensis]